MEEKLVSCIWKATSRVFLLWRNPHGTEDATHLGLPETEEKQYEFIRIVFLGIVWMRYRRFEIFLCGFVGATGSFGAFIIPPSSPNEIEKWCSGIFPSSPLSSSTPNPTNAFFALFGRKVTWKDRVSVFFSKNVLKYAYYSIIQWHENIPPLTDIHTFCTDYKNNKKVPRNPRSFCEVEV